MRMAVAVMSVQLVSSAIVAGCSDPPPRKPLPREVRLFPVTLNRDLDLLFMIDDSPSMADKQNNLAANFARFIEVLTSIPGGLPNVHIGVVTSDLGTQGAADSNPSFGPRIGQLGAGGCGGIGKDGNLQLFSAAGMVGGDLFLSDVADPATGQRTRNYAGGPDQLPVLFSRMAHAGAGGCGFEQHLEAIKHALAPSNMVNQNFLRKDANLGLVIITDEDDCSLNHYSLLGPASDALGPQQSFRCSRFGVTCDEGGATPDAMNAVGSKGACHPSDSSEYLTKVSDYAVFLKDLKADPAKIIVAVIAGDTEPVRTELRAPAGSTTPMPIPALAHSCTYIGGDITGDGVPDLEVADPAVRLKFFAEQFSNRNAFTSICQADLSGGLEVAGNLVKTAIGIPCFDNPLADVDPRMPGTQDDCDATITTGSDLSSATPLPRCTPEDGSATNQPCWHLVSDPASCPGGDHLAPRIEGRELLINAGYVIASCSI